MHGCSAHLDILARLDFARISAVLLDNLLLVGHILDPMNVFRSAATHLAFDGKRRQAGKDENGSTSTRGIVHSGSKTLGSYVDVHNDALGLACQSSVSIGHGQCNHLASSATGHAFTVRVACLVGTRDDLGKLALLLVLALDNGLNDGGVVRPEVDEDVTNAIFPKGLEEGKRRGIAGDG